MTTKTPVKPTPPLTPAQKQTAIDVGIAAERARRDAISRTVPADKIEWLGRIGGIGGHDWGVLNGQEYAVEVRRTIDAGSYVRRPGEILVSRVVEEQLDRDTFRTTETHRGPGPYPLGSYARLVAEAAEKRAHAVATRAPKPVDLLARLIPLRPTSASVLPLVSRALDSTFLEPGIVGPGEVLPLPEVPAARSVLLEGRPAVRGAEAILAALRSHGIELSLTPGGRLLVRARNGRLGDEWLSVVTRAERLLVGLLSGHPLVCELTHEGTAPEAATIVACGVAACAAHAAGEVL